MIRSLGSKTVPTLGVALGLILLPGLTSGQAPPPPDPLAAVAPATPPPPPPLSRRLQEVLALRVLLNLHLTASDIEAALPTLRDLRQAQQSLQARAQQDIDAERHALLVAGPFDPAPLTSADKIEHDLSRYRARQAALWAALSHRLGRTKAEGLRRLTEPPAPPHPPPPPPRPHPAPPMPETHLALSDLITLLTQKRAAMSRTVAPQHSSRMSKKRLAGH